MSGLVHPSWTVDNFSQLLTCDPLADSSLKRRGLEMLKVHKTSGV